MEKALETPMELSNRLGIPVSAIRKLVREGKLEHVFLSQSMRNPKIPFGAWENFLDQNSVKPSLPRAHLFAERQGGAAK